MGTFTVYCTRRPLRSSGDIIAARHRRAAGHSRGCLSLFRISDEKSPLLVRAAEWKYSITGRTIIKPYYRSSLNEDWKRGNNRRCTNIVFKIFCRNKAETRNGTRKKIWEKRERRRRRRSRSSSSSSSSGRQQWKQQVEKQGETSYVGDSRVVGERERRREWEESRKIVKRKRYRPRQGGDGRGKERCAATPYVSYAPLLVEDTAGRAFYERTFIHHFEPLNICRGISGFNASRQGIGGKLRTYDR